MLLCNLRDLSSANTMPEVLREKIKGLKSDMFSIVQVHSNNIILECTQ